MRNAAKSSDIYEVDDATSSARALLLDARAEDRTIYPAGDVDWVRVNVTRPSTVRLGSYHAVDYDVYDSGGNLVEESTGNGRAVGLEEPVIHLGQEAEAMGTLLIRIRASGDSKATFYYRVEFRSN